jgi:hypothetical protein
MTFVESLGYASISSINKNIVVLNFLDINY